jgi:hypothetical protein
VAFQRNDEAFSIDLSVWGSLITDVAPQVLPLGASPDNQDVCFFVGYIQIRPALVRALAASIGNVSVTSVANFAANATVPCRIFLTADGELRSNNPATETNTTMGQVLPGSTFKACSSFGKQFYAFFNNEVTSEWSANPFCGADIPRYWNGTALNKVTPAAPSTSPSFQNVQSSPFDLVEFGGSGSLTITQAQATGVKYTTIEIPVINNPFIDPTISYQQETIIYYTQVVFTCSSSAASLVVGSSVAVTGMSNNALNLTGTVIAQTGDTFTLAVNLLASLVPTNPLTGQSGSAVAAGVYLSRNGNIVTACCGATLPSFVQPGYWLQVENADGTQIQGADWTATNFSLNSTGIITVTLDTYLTNLLPGAQLYVEPTPLSATISGGSVATGVLSMTATNTFVAGESITLSGFSGAGAVLNGLVVSVVSATGSAITAYAAVANVASIGTGTATDSTIFSPGFIEVLSVAQNSSGNTIFTYQASVSTLQNTIQTSGGTVYQVWSGFGGTYANAWQVTNVYENGGNWFVQWFQLGPNAVVASGSFYGQPISQLQGGVRYIATVFETADAAQTAPSPPLQITTYGGIYFLSVSGILLGPSGTSSRVLLFTAADGEDFFYLAPSFAPAASGGPPLLQAGTILNDNVTTSAVIDFSDVSLVAGVAADENTDEGNDLFSQIELPPCLGVEAFSDRLVWWGALNLIDGLVNLSFDGGYAPFATTGNATNGSARITGLGFFSAWAGSQIVVAGTLYTIQSATATSITLTSPFIGSTGTVTLSVLSPVGALPGAYTIANAGIATLVETIDETGFGFQVSGEDSTSWSQACYQTWDGAPIFAASTSYLFRCLVSLPAGGSTGTGTLRITLASATTGFSSVATIALDATQLSESPSWVEGAFSAATPASLPSDLTWTAVFSGTMTAVFDEQEFVNLAAPVLQNSLLFSYSGNPFGYSGATGLVTLQTTDSFTAAFPQRAYFYPLTNKSLWQTRDNGTTEPFGWTFTPYASNCGASGPNAVDYSEETAWWAGRYGARIFNGNPTVNKLSQEINSKWEAINWNAQTLMWVKNDPVQKCTYWGVPTNGSATVNQVFYLSFRLVSDLYDIPDPIHVSQYTGKILATDMSRKWSIWNAPVNAADMCQVDLGQGLAYYMHLAGADYGNLYTLNFQQSLETGLDDDYGLIPAYYVTYFWFAHDVEMQPILTQFNKVYNYLSIHAVGLGKLQLTPYADALSNPLPAVPSFAISLTDPGYDFQMPINVKGNRVAWKIQALPNSPGQGASFQITNFIIQGAVDKFTPVRGSVFAV